MGLKMKANTICLAKQIKIPDKNVPVDSIESFRSNKYTKTKVEVTSGEFSSQVERSREVTFIIT